MINKFRKAGVFVAAAALGLLMAGAAATHAGPRVWCTAPPAGSTPTPSGSCI